MGEHPSGQSGPMPEDPFPDLTLIDLDRLTPTPELWPLRLWQDLNRDDHVVVLAEVVERTLEGTPLFVRIIA